MPDTSLLLTDYVESYAARGIHLDPFQIEACQALDNGRDVLVSAPTGSGKTVVANYAVTLALASSRRCIYTAPIKALSNQKHAELARTLGEDNVGLLTGDVTINRDAPILIVTTEVLRNMLFQGAPEIDDVGYVVLDEVHYLADRDRGPVWEEVILSLPAHVRLVSLSATVANSGEVIGWLRSVRGSTELIKSDVRPVPLDQHVAVGRRILPLYGEGDEPSSALIRALRAQADRAPERHDRRRRLTDSDRRRLIETLEDRDMLPAIEFIFSRKGCDMAVRALIKADVWLTSRAEQNAIREQVDELRDTLSESDRRAVHFETSASALVRGFGAHHAGVLPALKSLTERLMEQGLLRIVYATGTLALGIDMPVRSVVLEELRRFDGQGFVDLSATEYTQLIGRAGRRGKDLVGNAVVIGSDDLDAWALADLGSGRVEPLVSAFTPSYNTVVNLLADQTYSAARDLMGASFAQYQRNADLGQIEARAQRIRRGIQTEEAHLTCERGDLVEYLRKRAALGRAAKSARKQAKRTYRTRIAQSFEAARTGVLYAFARGGVLEYGVVLSVGDGKLRILDWYGQMSWLREGDLSSELREVGEVVLPHGRSMRDRDAREQVAEAIIEAVDERSELGLDRDLLDSWDRFAEPRDEVLADHPCHTCPDLEAHIKAGESLLSLDARLRELQEMAENFHDSVGREFDKTVGVLVELGILQRSDEGVYLGPGAPMLRELHVDSDLLLYQCLSELREGQLDSASMAGWASMFLADDRLGSSLPHSGALAGLARRAGQQAEFLQNLELRYEITRTGVPTPGCADIFAGWVSGATLEECLAASGMAAGDFITAARRVVDLLGQIAQAGGEFWFADVARKARSGMQRGELL